MLRQWPREVVLVEDGELIHRQLPVLGSEPSDGFFMTCALSAMWQVASHYESKTGLRGKSSRRSGTFQNFNTRFAPRETLWDARCSQAAAEVPLHSLLISAPAWRLRFNRNRLIHLRVQMPSHRTASVARRAGTMSYVLDRGRGDASVVVHLHCWVTDGVSPRARTGGFTWSGRHAGRRRDRFRAAGTRSGAALDCTTDSSSHRKWQLSGLDFQLLNVAKWPEADTR